MNFSISAMQENKKLLRRTYREKRKNLSEKERKLSNREICRNFYANITIPKRSVVAGYIAMGDEVNISMLMDMYREDGHKIVLPVVREDKQPLIFKEYDKKTKLIINEKYKFSEPEGTKELNPYLIIVPLVAFDSACNRLGQGAGFYDRTLEQLSIDDFLAVGVGFAIQQAPYIEVDKYDFQLDAVVTEERVIVKQ